MNRSICSAGVLLSAALLSGQARADLISYTFSGTDEGTNNTVAGTFSYQANAPVSYINSSGANFYNALGSLSITVGGQTYSSNLISASLYSQGLTLSNVDRTGLYFELNLTTSYSGTLLTNFNNLPSNLNLQTFQGSSYTIGQRPPPPPPGHVGITLIRGIASGYITALNVASDAAVAPEPGGVLLAVLGGAGLAFASLCRRTRFVLP
jgi:hypothetical protein